MLILTVNESGSIEHFLLPSGTNSAVSVSSSYKDGFYWVKIDGIDIASAVAQPLSSYNRQLIPSVDVANGKIKIRFSNGNIFKTSSFKLTVFTSEMRIDPGLPYTPTPSGSYTPFKTNTIRL